MSTSIVQYSQSVHQGIRNILISIQQQKWARAYTEELALKTKLMNAKAESMKMLSDVRCFLRGPSAYTTNEQDEPVHILMDAFVAQTSKDIERQLSEFASTNVGKLTTRIQQLQAAPLANKHSMLRSVPLVSVPIGAAFLGINTSMLYKFTADFAGIIGDFYAGGYCLSIDEILMIEQNPQWCGAITRVNEVTAKKPVDGRIFDHMLNVNECVACAFANMTPSELRSTVQQNSQTRRPFRLADLEKVRVEKLSKNLA
jgi:hypothetical protein